MYSTKEHTEQCEVIEWWEMRARDEGIDPRVLFAIPNGGVRHIGEAVKLKAEGVRKGIPDLFLAHPVAPFHGLFIEMKKSRGGKVSDDQRECIQFLSNEGYACTVARGADDAISCIDTYLNGFFGL